MATFQIEVKTATATTTREVEAYNLRMAWQTIDVDDARHMARSLDNGVLTVAITDFRGERRTVTIR